MNKKKIYAYLIIIITLIGTISLTSNNLFSISYNQYSFYSIISIIILTLICGSYCFVRLQGD